MVTQCKKNFFQDSTNERMNHFDISVTVKRRLDGLEESAGKESSQKVSLFTLIFLFFKNISTYLHAGTSRCQKDLS